MFWEEDEDKSVPCKVPDDVIDISFGIKARTLPIDHAWSLSQAIARQLPWIHDDPLFAIQQIHVAETGNGWLRPEDDDNELLWPSRRTRLYLRIPKERSGDVETLQGKTLDIGGHELTLSGAKVRELTNASVIFSRYVLSAGDEDEHSFLSRMHEEIHDLTGVKVRKMICGKSNTVRTPEDILSTRHLMIADLESDPSIKIQQHGLGDGRLLGCGIFLPHKGIKSLNPKE